MMAQCGRRTRLGSVIPLALMMGLLLLVVGFALAMLATSNLNLATAEANRQKALELARAGANQYLVDMAAAASDKDDTSVQLLLLRPTHAVLPPPTRFRALVPTGPQPYPLPNSHLEGKCYITFDATKPYYSVDNTNSASPADGWMGPATVPPFSLDLIVTGKVNGFSKHIEVVISKRWDYALTTPCCIDIGGSQVNSQWVPSRIEGDVFTGSDYDAGAGPVINVGRCEPSPGAWEFSSNNVINGYLRVKSKNESSVHVESQNGQNSVAGTKFGSTEALYPSVNLPDTGSWTDLAAEYTYERRADHLGCWLAPYVQDGTNCYAIESEADPPQFKLVGGRYLLSGNLVGKKQDGTASSATELVLDGASLKVDGSLQFSDHPKRLFGDQAVLWVTNELKFHDGFIDGGTNGFVVYSRVVDTKAGGSFRGLMLVEETLKMSPFDRKIQEGSADAVTYATLQTRSVAAGSRSLFLKEGDRHVATMEVRGGVFTPAQNIYALLYRILAGLPPVRFQLKSVSVTWDPVYLTSLHKYADLKISYWQEIP